MDILILLCVFFGFIAFYYFNKFQESEKAYYSLHFENNSMKTRIEDLQLYQKDVSKTFKILDSELGKISDKINKTPTNQEQINISSRPRVSIFTPEIIESLFPIRNTNNTINTNIQEQLHQNQDTQEELKEQELQHISNNYDKLLI